MTTDDQPLSQSRPTHPAAAQDPGTPDPVTLTVAGAPPLRWLADHGSAEVDGTTLHLSAGPRTDWFTDPDGSATSANAAVLTFGQDGDCQLSARVKVGFTTQFDAGVLFVHRSADDYAKLCFERSPAGENTVVSVVTRRYSDDANGPVIHGDEVWLRVSAMGPVHAFHYSLDGSTWEMVRLFRLDNPDAPTRIGFCSQAPLGERCRASFADIAYATSTLADPRDGS